MAIAAEVRDIYPNAVAAGFGRVFYGGEEVVYFSQIIENEGNFGKCYQTNDPTSEDFNAVLDTDGGKLKVSGAKGINKLVQWGKGMLVIAKNGVWFIRGNDSGFTATSFSVDKIDNATGCVNPQSVVDAPDGVYYWSDNEIIKIHTDEFGNILATDVSSLQIKKFYQEILGVSKENCTGAYDRNEKQVGWLYKSVATSDPNDYDREVLFRLDTQGWYPQEFASKVSTGWEISASFSLDITSDDVIKRYIIRDGSDNYSVAYLTDPSFQDFGIDYPTAYIETGYETLGNSGHSKSATYAVIHMERTEDGFDVNLDPTSPSSCIFQAKWDWHNSAAGNRWSVPEQVYRYRRQYLPADDTDDYDTGAKMIEFKAKVRGGGSAVSFRFSTEPQKDLQLYGFEGGYEMKGRLE